jgi:CheY-like chemotaxis protein
MANDPNKTILCIDDDHGALAYLRALLERRGYVVLTAASAREGLEIAAGRVVAAIVVDYQMPEMYGDEVATAVKRLKPEVPIVMVSSSDEIPDQALSTVDAFVPKDETLNHLVPAIMRVCEESSVRAPAHLAPDNG